MVKFGATDFSDTVREKFQRHCSATNIIPVEQRSFVYRTVLTSDGKKAFDDLVEVGISTDKMHEFSKILILLF